VECIPRRLARRRKGVDAAKRKRRNGTTALSEPLPPRGAHASRRLLQEGLQVLGRHGVCDPARLREHGLLRPFDEHHVDDAEDLTRVGVVNGTAAVAGIGGRVELENPKGTAAYATDYLGAELGRSSLRNRNSRDGCDHGTMCRPIQGAEKPDQKYREQDAFAL